MVNEPLQLTANGFSFILITFIFFSPFISLVTNKKFLRFIRGMKSMSVVYVFVLFITFLIGRGVFLLTVQLSKNLYSLPTSTFGIICFLSSSFYWYFAGKFIKSEKDMIGMLTLMYAAEIFWFVLFYSISAMIVGYFLFYF